MARDHARLMIRIWADDDFVRMNEGPQRLYMLLLSQEHINRAGVLDLRPRRWAQLAADSTTESVEKALQELEAAKFVALDEDTEELLVRSFIRNDEIYKQPNVFKNALNSARQVQSRRLRCILAEELRRLADLVPADRRDVETNREGVSKAAALLEPKGSANPYPNPSGNPSTNPPSEPFVEPFVEPPGEGEGEGEGVLLPSSVVLSSSEASDEEDSKSARRKPSRHLPADWKPTESHRDRATSSGLDLAEQVELFRANAETNDRSARNWNGAFTTWLINAKRYEARNGRPAPQPRLDQASAKAWLLGEYDAGRIVPIQQRTGLHYREPDLPLDVTGKAAVEEFHLQAIRDWIKHNNVTIIERLIARSA